MIIQIVNNRNRPQESQTLKLSKRLKITILTVFKVIKDEIVKLHRKLKIYIQTNEIVKSEGTINTIKNQINKLTSNKIQ